MWISGSYTYVCRAECSKIQMHRIREFWQTGGAEKFSNKGFHAIIKPAFPMRVKHDKGDNMTLDISCCGIVCSDCPVYEAGCPGCNSAEGVPAWMEEVDIDICPIYNCCVLEKELSHCSGCENLPCAIFFELMDPSMNEAEHHEAVGDRVALLRSLKI